MNRVLPPEVHASMVRIFSCSRPAIRPLLLVTTLATLLVLVPCTINALEARVALPGDVALEHIPESTDLRIKIWNELMQAPIAATKDFRARNETNYWGAWRISVQKSGDALYTIVAPARGSDFPIHAQGSWIIKRSLRDGLIQQVKIFLRSDPGTFVRVYPFGDRSRIDVVAYNGVLYHQVIVPLAFETLLRSPFSRIRDLTRDIVDWSLFSPDPALFADLRRLADQVRVRLPDLRYADDGAIDADGRAVFISSLLPQGVDAGLNCSGFVKWLVDGIIHPFSGSYLPVASIKERMLDWRGSSFTIKFEETLDPFFGLDWSRAIAGELWAVMYPSRIDASPLAHDVTEAPFAMVVRDSDPVNGGSAYEAFSDNFNDAGIELRGLKAMLFMLASREPGRFYLAQFNARSDQPPRLRQYFHIAALFPYFDDDGIFRVVVFESAAETSLDRIVSDRDYEFVKLVRVPTSGRFEPQSLPSGEQIATQSP